MRRGRVALAACAVAALVCAFTWYWSGPESARSSTAAAVDAGAGAATTAQAEDAQRRRRVAGGAVPARQASGQSPLPPPGTPLAQIYDNLKRRADAGDGEAATRLFHDVHRCIALRQTRHLLADLPSDASGEVGIVRAGQMQFKRVPEMKEYIEANGARCEEATDAQLAVFTPLLLQAAQRGDIRALDCYVGTDFDAMDGVLDHPEWIDQYRAEVPGLVESALRRGDWVIVDLLHRDPYSDAYDTSARGQLFGNDPAMDFRMLRLEQLGASGRFADWLAAKVAGAARTLSPTQLAAAEAWASDYYSRYFNSVSNEVSNGANICDFNDD
jgi:hypothetical protein